MIDRIGPRKPPRIFVREWMKHRKVTQTTVAERMDCGTGTVSKLLSGKMEMTTYWLAGFAEALQVEPVDLFRDPIHRLNWTYCAAKRQPNKPKLFG